MKSKQAYKMSLKVIAILSVVICGSTTAPSIANVPEGATEKHDTSVKGDNTASHPVGDLTIAQGQQLIGDEIGVPSSTGKGRKLKGQQLIGDEIGVPSSTEKGHKLKGQQLIGDEIGVPSSTGKGRKLKRQKLTGDELGFPQSKGNKRK
ncbi:hypothetical protein MNBD_NITROSPINAE05-239 [hydrothermal vent metagenome]|uniref:Uncharacterized protein n=1 Tax=hydrothermal vent metagenome TaxID=652676 RepID=A0A3B1CUC0_9ZZZZ